MHKKETQKGRRVMGKAVEHRIAALIDKYFSTHDVYVRPSEDRKRNSGPRPGERKEPEPPRNGSDSGRGGNPSPNEPTGQEAARDKEEHRTEQEPTSDTLQSQDTKLLVETTAD